MSVEIAMRETYTVLGMSFPRVTTLEADGAVVKTPTIAAAKTGTLTTRTDANTGTLTMSASHGITTGARLDLYWTGGARRGITVGTVSVNSVPFDLGSGDDLPTNNTAITAMVPTSEAFVVTGDNAGALLVSSEKYGTIVFAESDDTEVAYYLVGGSAGAEQSNYWTPARSATNPLASGDITKVYFSHGDSTASSLMRAVVLIS